MSFIQNLFTSRDNNANAETYIGQEGRLWWDPETNSFYYSDGTTPGGIPVQSSVQESSVVESNNTVVADSNTPTVITDMSMSLDAGKYLVTFNSEYTDSLGAVTATAAADLAILYDYLMALTPTVTDHAPEYGGETLGPGVYTQAGASSIAGTLTLDAGGNANALFVFRSVGALTTGVGAEIVLTGGATSKNVWWVAQGAASTGANTVFRGSLLTNQAAVSVGAGTQIEGRMLAINGAAAVGDTSFFTEPTGTSSAPLGSIALFSIFTAIGAISNTGASEIALSIGTDSGTITGFETATVGGEIYPGGVADLAVISYGIYVGGVLVADSERSQTQTGLVSGWPMTLQTLITLSSTQTVDVRTQVPIGEFSIGPGMSFVALAVSSTGSGGNVSVSDRITSPNGSYSTIINNSGITTAAGNVVPLADNVSDLGSEDLRWRSAFIGPGSLYIDTAILTVEDNALKIVGVPQLAVGQLSFVENTIESITGNIDIEIGLIGSTANLILNRNTVTAAGKTFGLEDATSGQIATLSSNNGEVIIAGAAAGLVVGNINIFQNTIESTAGNIDLIIGNTAATANLILSRNTVTSAGKTFGLEDATDNQVATLSANNGYVVIAGKASGLIVGDVEIFQNTVESTAGNVDLIIGNVSATANLVLSRNTVMASGKTFTTTGNITGNYFIGNGSQLTGITGETYTGNATTISISEANEISVINVPNSVLGPIQGIEFDITHTHVGEEPGTLCWNPDDDTLNIQHTGGVAQQVGQELYAQVKNVTGNTIPNGTVVRFDGASSNGDVLLEAAPFQANGVYPSLYALGVTTQDITNNGKGLVTTWGKIRDLDTTGGAENWAQGDILYASPTTAGGFTKIKPTAPNNVVPVAAVLTVSDTAGVIFVRPTIEQKYGYGQFARTTDANVAATNTAYVVTFDTTQSSNGVSIGSPASRLVVEQSGFYQIDINAQVEIGGGANETGTMFLWIRKNGVDIANSMRRQGQRGEVPSLSFSYNISLSLEANDYIEIAYAADDTDMRFDATTATAFGPSTASMLVGITQVQL